MSHKNYYDKYIKYKQKYINLKQLKGGSEYKMIFYEPGEVMIYSKMYNNANTILEWKKMLSSEKNCDSKCELFRDILNELEESSGNIPKLIDRLNENGLSIYRTGKIKTINSYHTGINNIYYSAGHYKGEISKYYYLSENDVKIGIEASKKKFRNEQLKKLYTNKLIDKSGYLLGVGYNEDNLWHFDIVIGGKKNYGENNVQCVNREIKEETGMVPESLVNIDGSPVDVSSTKENIFFTKYENNKFVYPRFSTRKSSNSAAFSYVYFENIDMANLFLENCKFGELGIDTFKNLSFVNKTTLAIFNVDYLFKVFDVK